MNNKRIGILLDERGFICTGSQPGMGTGIIIGDTLQQNERIILASQKGELKEEPLMGAAIADMVNDNDPLAWRWHIAEELARDGIRVQEMSIDNEKLDITADYEG